MEIPVLRCDRTAGTHREDATTEGIRGESGKPGTGQKTCGKAVRETTEMQVGESVEAMSRKAAIVRSVPVPKTDTGG